MVGFGWTGFDQVCLTLTGLDEVGWVGLGRTGKTGQTRLGGFQGVVLPVRPSTLRVWKDLQKFDPLGYPLEPVNYPLGFCLLLPVRFWSVTASIVRTAYASNVLAL